jgi:hypothetical protein
MALGFVPQHLVVNTFQTLKANGSTQLEKLYAYFEQQWLGNVSLKMWNVFESETRTNNHCEGWHNRFNRAVNKHHPNLWHLLQCILDEQSATDVIRCQIAAGHQVVRQDKTSKFIQQRIETIRSRYVSGVITVIDYVTAISHSLINPKK